MGIALSTSWNAYRFTDGNSVISEIRELGFKEIELSFNLTSEMVDDIAKFVNRGEIKVISAHNFCPVPFGIEREKALPDYYSMSSLDEAQRQLAVKQTKLSIDTAVRLNAQAVVLHCGRIEMPDHTRDLIALYEKGAKHSKEYIFLKDKIQKEREQSIKPFFENTLRSLDEINTYAVSRDIDLGIENRFYIREIPSFNEIAVILDKFKGSNVFYWHDSGHAKIFENLGLINHHEDYLDAYKDELCGLHLHNVSGCADHQGPLKGEIDFNKLVSYVEKETLKVIESHSQATGQDLKEGLSYLDNLFNAKA